MPVRHNIRTSNGGTKAVSLTRDKAIRAFCTECLSYEDHPDICTSLQCPLYPFRGKTMLAYDGGKRDE